MEVFDKLTEKLKQKYIVQFNCVKAEGNNDFTSK
jgi:hypothetical protein